MGTTAYIGGSVGGVVGVIALCCCFFFCFGIFGALCRKSHSSSSQVISPPLTVDVAGATAPRLPGPGPSPQGAAFFAVKDEVVVMKAKEKTHPKAQTHAGEAPPPYYYSANNYPKANY